MAMLKGVPDLTLSLLNEATQAWVEREYQRDVHGETHESPLNRAIKSPILARPSPSSEQMRPAFRMHTTRAQRRTDGTFTVSGVRFEVPNAYRTLVRLHVLVARWDLSSVELCDPKTGGHLCTALPLDKHKNADRRRGRLHPMPPPSAPLPPAGIAPHLRALMQEYAQTGLPPAYLPKESVSTLAHKPDQPLDKETP